MHPAFSIIFFTTMSGLGYGLAAMLGLGLLDPSAASTKTGLVLALVLIAAGLLSSTLHLGNPQRAWRALSQWRSSWLSREGVLAILAFIPLVLSAAAALFLSRSLPVTGLIGAALSFATVYSTAMIYGSLKSIPAWHTPLTPASYLSFALAGGLTFASLLSALGGSGPAALPWLAALAVALSWAVKTAWWRRLDALAPTSTPETATGLGAIGRVRLLERPHMNGNYLTREMGFRIARKHAAKLRMIALLAGGALSASLLVVSALTAGATAASCAFLALALFYAGTFVERWLFFAEARHAVMAYYDGGSVANGV